MVDNPHMRDENVKMTTDAVKYVFLPKKSDNILASGMMITLEIA
jgi:hypothetical protein